MEDSAKVKVNVTLIDGEFEVDMKCRGFHKVAHCENAGQVVELVYDFAEKTIPLAMFHDLIGRLSEKNVTEY